MDRRAFSSAVGASLVALALPALPASAAAQSPPVSNLVRFHSPTLGPREAPVTIVEFFDPACEACRAVHPFVKALLERYPQEVRLVLRYAPFHEGSEAVVRLLEASKRQGRYWQVLEALLDAQPQWASHRRPDIQVAYRAAERAGLNLKQALADGGTPQIDAVLKQDMDDLAAFRILATPSFFVNGEAVLGGPDMLATAVAAQVGRVRAGATR